MSLVSTSREDEAVRRMRQWSMVILGCLDVGIGAWAYRQDGGIVAVIAAVSFAGFFVMAWLIYLWLLGRL
jgi:hypothetical protein